MKCFRHYVVSCVIILSLASCKKEAAARNAPPPPPPPDPNLVVETAPAIQTAVNVSVGNKIGGFYQALPARYTLTTKSYPLIIFVHGVGELGNGNTDLPKVLKNAIPRLLDENKFPPSFKVNQKEYSFIVLSPQFRNWPGAVDINAMIDYAIDNYRIDTSRIYIAGISMGGGVTWEFAGGYQSRAAAIVPVCGTTLLDKDRCARIATANLPVWAFHNTDDPLVSVNTTKHNIATINNYDPHPRAKETIWESGGHNSWTKATSPDYKEANMNIYEWMLQYTRNR